jgi:5-methylcytosine-specific restriction protein A
VDPIADLRPVCPNCHAVIHLNKQPFTIEDVQAMVKRSRARQTLATS